jgi:hypothetical protein
LRTLLVALRRKGRHAQLHLLLVMLAQWLRSTRQVVQHSTRRESTVVAKLCLFEDCA